MIERNLGNVVMATTTKTPVNPSIQIEVCIELLCKYLVAFFELEKPSATIVDKYLNSLRELSTKTNRVKARARFLLIDFFKAIDQQSQ